MWILPGQADNCVTVNVGWGRTHAGRYRQRRRLQRLPAPHERRARLRRTDATLAKTGKTSLLAQTQEHQSMEGRPSRLTRRSTEYRKNPDFAQYQTPDPKVLPLWKPRRVQRSTSGGWSSTSPRAPGATPASSPARPRTTSRSSARTRSIATARCTGSASTATSSATTRPSPSGSPSSRSPACSARTRPARTSARSTPRRTAPKG